PGRAGIAAGVSTGRNSWAGSGIRAMLARWTDQEAAVTMAPPQVRARRTFAVGAWRSQVARIVRDDEVGGSNPLAPTIITSSNRRPQKLQRMATSWLGFADTPRVV